MAKSLLDRVLIGSTILLITCALAAVLARSTALVLWHDLHATQTKAKTAHGLGRLNEALRDYR